MSVFLNTAISALDKPSSLAPFFVKDAFDVTGRTVMANNEGGKHEAREKFIEEAGTSVFWIGGIPAVKWIADKIAKAKGNIDPDIHFKRINTTGVQSYFAKAADGIELGGEKLTQIKQNLSQSKGQYKKYHVGVTTTAVLLNLFMLTVALPKFNQLLSKKIIEKEVKKEKEDVKAAATFAALKQKQQNKKAPSFGSLKDIFNFTKMAENNQLNVVSNILLLDYGISGSRVTFVPRNKDERVEYAVKEGGIILFFYYAAGWIKSGLSALADKVFKTPIDLDYNIINDKDFAEKLKAHKDPNEILSFVGKDADELSVIKLIDKELAQTKTETPKNKVFNNFTLQMAQKNSLIDVEYDEKLGKWIRHSKKYIETDKVVKLNENLKRFYDQAIKKGGDIEKVIAKTKVVKVASVLGNLAICCASLSYFLPKLQYLIRTHRTKSSEAPGIKHYQEMAKKNIA